MRKRKPNIDRIFHALGDPTRRAIMEKLGNPPAIPLVALAALQCLDLTGIGQ